MWIITGIERSRRINQLQHLSTLAGILTNTKFFFFLTAFHEQIPTTDIWHNSEPDGNLKLNCCCSPVSTSKLKLKRWTQQVLLSVVIWPHPQSLLPSSSGKMNFANISQCNWLESLQLAAHQDGSTRECWDEAPKTLPRKNQGVRKERWNKWTNLGFGIGYWIIAAVDVRMQKDWPMEFWEKSRQIITHTWENCGKEKKCRPWCCWKLL